MQDLVDAVKKGNIDEVKEFFSNKSCSHETIKKALILACKTNQKIVEIIIQKLTPPMKYLINEADSDNNTPLSNACISGQHKIIKYLISNGAKVNNTNVKINLPEIIIKKNKLNILKLLVSHGAKLSDSLLITSSEYGSSEISKYLLSFRPNVHIKNSDNETAFIKAAQYGKLDIIKLLIEYTDHSDEYSDALNSAIIHKQIEIVDFFIDIGVSLENVDSSILLLKKWPYDTMVELLNHTNDLKMISATLINAIHLKEKDIITLLLINGASLDFSADIEKIITKDIKLLQLIETGRMCNAIITNTTYSINKKVQIDANIFLHIFESKIYKNSISEYKILIDGINQNPDLDICIQNKILNFITSAKSSLMCYEASIRSMIENISPVPLSYLFKFCNKKNNNEDDTNEIIDLYLSDEPEEILFSKYDVLPNIILNTDLDEDTNSYYSDHPDEKYSYGKYLLKVKLEDLVYNIKNNPLVHYEIERCNDLIFLESWLKDKLNEALIIGNSTEYDY